jgi:hypothetical protein
VLLSAGSALAWQPAEPEELRGPVAGPDGRISLAATTLFGLASGGGGRPLACLAVLRAGDEKELWSIVDTSKVRPFPDAWRSWVTDERPILDDPPEVEAYAQTLALAHWTDTAALDKAARRDLTYVQLFRDSAKYRGEIVRIAGRMKRIRRYDDPPERARLAGVAHIYEGWLFNDDFGTNPVCCVFTDLPEGMRASEKMEERVEFAGYFFKRYRYKAADTPGANQWRDAPLLIGRVVAVLPHPPETSSDDWSRPLLPIFLSLVGGTIAFVVLLTVWLNRSDRHVRRRLTAVAPQTFEPPPEPTTEPPPDLPADAKD